MYSLRYDAQAAREAAWDDGRIEGENKGIKAAIAMAKKLSATRTQVVEQLMESFNLTHDQATAAVQANW